MCRRGDPGSGGRGADMSQYRNFANRRGYGGGGGASPCIISDAVPVFYCYVVVKFFLKRASKFDK